MKAESVASVGSISGSLEIDFAFANAGFPATNLEESASLNQHHHNHDGIKS